MNTTLRGFVYGIHYFEKARLADGSEIVLRPVTGADRCKVLEGFERLSQNSRYERFHGHKRELSERDLVFLSEDGSRKNFAIIALVITFQGDEGEAIGGARFEVLTDQPNVAELAVTVIDDYQGRGLGRLLLDRIVAAAIERGIDHIRVHVLAGNERMRKLITSLLGEGHLTRDGTVLSGDFPLREVTARKHRSAVRALLEQTWQLAVDQSILPLRLALSVSAANFATLGGG